MVCANSRASVARLRENHREDGGLMPQSRDRLRLTVAEKTCGPGEFVELVLDDVEHTGR